jgi:hypothetical protein
VRSVFSDIRGLRLRSRRVPVCPLRPLEDPGISPLCSLQRLRNVVRRCPPAGRRWPWPKSKTILRPSHVPSRRAALPGSVHRAQRPAGGRLLSGACGERLLDDPDQLRDVSALQGLGRFGDLQCTRNQKLRHEAGCARPGGADRSGGGRRGRCGRCRRPRRCKRHTGRRKCHEQSGERPHRVLGVQRSLRLARDGSPPRPTWP